MGSRCLGGWPATFDPASRSPVSLLRFSSPHRSTAPLAAKMRGWLLRLAETAKMRSNQRLLPRNLAHKQESEVSMVTCLPAECTWELYIPTWPVRCLPGVVRHKQTNNASLLHNPSMHNRHRPASLYSRFRSGGSQIAGGERCAKAWVGVITLASPSSFGLSATLVSCPSRLIYWRTRTRLFGLSSTLFPCHNRPRGGVDVPRR